MKQQVRRQAIQETRTSSDVTSWCLHAFTYISEALHINEKYHR